MLLETIRIESGKTLNLEYHQKRVDRSRERLFNLQDRLELSKCLTNIPKKGIYRCKIIYSDTIRSVEYIPYRYVPKYRYIAVESSIDYR